MPPDLADVPEVDKVLAVDLEKPVELSVSRAVSSGVIVCSPSGGVAMNHLRSSFILLLLCAVAAVPGTAQESVEVPFYLPTPEGWRTETIPFPLEFAPELDYEGLEELRFAPGMFKEGSADFWSYAFVWWVPEETGFETERLQTDLERYFRGLTTAVAEAREFDPGEPDHNVKLKPIKSSAPDHPHWEGTAATYDVFVTRKPIQLNVRIDLVSCSSQGQVASIFQLSPQLHDNSIWEVLDNLRQEFRCKPE
jgi:hypothetical protein